MTTHFDKEYATFPSDCIDIINPPETNKTIGLDFGLTTFLADSNSIEVKPRKFYLHMLRRIISNRAKIRDSSQEGEFSVWTKYHNGTREPSNSYRRFKRDVCGIMANGKLLRAVEDCGWHELRRQLTHKAHAMVWKTTDNYRPV